MKQPLQIFILTLLVYLLTAGGHLYSPDEEILFRSTQSLWEDWDLAIEPLGAGGFATSRNAVGLEYAQYGVGQVILALPFYAAGKLVAPVLSDAAWMRVYGITPEEPPESRGHPSTAAEIAPRFFCSFFNIVVSAIMAALLYSVAMLIKPHEAAARSVAFIYAFGSLAWPHSRPFFTETLAVFWILLAWFALLKGTRERMTLWCAVAGAAAGFAALTRMDSVLLYPGLAIILLGPIRRSIAERKPRWHPFIAFCAPAALCGAAILALNALHFGGPFASGYSDQPEGINFSTPILAGLYGFLFSVGKGILFFSPPLILCGWSWCAMHRVNRDLCRAALVSVLIPLLVMSKWQNWAGGWCWGPRHLVMIHVFLALPVICWLARSYNPQRRFAVRLLLLIGIAVQLLGTSQDFVEFHRIFFRSPSQSFHVLYDQPDQAYWSRYYSLRAHPPGAGEVPVPLAAMPAPIQHSLYLPQSSVWAGYPLMWKMGLLDNLWIRLLR